MFLAWRVLQQRWLCGLFVTLLVLLLGSACGAGSSSTTQESSTADTTTAQSTTKQTSEEATLEAALEKSFQQSSAPGVVAAVQTPDYKWVRALGVADRSSKEPMTPDVHHRIASVTKTFTGTLLLQAEAEGLLSLDDKIDQYIEGVPDGDKITLRQLANHTSGIASYEEDKQFQDEWASDPERAWTPQELVQVGIKDSPLFDPGTDFHYSNTNTVLLGLVLEQVTGKPIGELYRERIIEPLGLQDTSFSGADPSIPDPHAHGYTLFGQSAGAEPVDATDWNPSVAWTAGGIISTVEDLLVYGQAMGTGDGLLSPEQQAERLDSLLPDPTRPEMTYGIGLAGARGWLGHTGEIPGFTTTLFYHPDLDATVVVEVNTDIVSGDCPADVPTMPDAPRDIPCNSPADRINQALTEALGKPFPPPPNVSANLEKAEMDKN